MIRIERKLKSEKTKRTIMILQDGQRIVFVGDSVTDSGRKRPIGEGLWDGTGNGYVRNFESFLNVFYPDRKIRVTNMGISGNTSRDLLIRFESDVLALHPNHVSICIGFNDVWRFFDEPSHSDEHVGREEYRANLEKMADMCITRDIKTVFLSPYYLETNVIDSMRKMMDEYRAICKEVAETKKCDYVDFQEPVDKLLEKTYPAFISWDRVHPGYKLSLLMAIKLLKYYDFDFKLIEEV